MSFALKEKQRHLNPLEQLQERKRELRYLCRKEERLLKESWEYSRKNSGSLLLSGVTGLLFARQRRTAEEACFSGSILSGSIFSMLWSAIRPLLDRCKR